MAKTFKVTGNTYPARTVLKDAGFVWNKEEKAWFGNEEAGEELERITTATYSRANQKAVEGIKIEEIEQNDNGLEKQTEEKTEEKIEVKYAGYHVDGSKAEEFRAEAKKLFANADLKKELQWRMTNLCRETMSFDLDTRLDCPKEILELAEKFGKGFNSYA